MSNSKNHKQKRMRRAKIKAKRNMAQRTKRLPRELRNKNKKGE
jgi:hypothetical protein